MHSLRHWTSFFVGLIIFALGLLPLIGKGKWLGPLGNSTPGVILAYIVAFGGLYIIFDSFFEFTFHSGMGIATLVVGLLVFGFGLVIVLKSLGAVPFGPAPSALNLLVYNILFMLEGLFLMLGCFVMD